MSRKSLSFFQIVMINVIAVGSLRTLPFASIYGISLLFFYGIAAVCFFLPTALVAAELGTAWPHAGGIYAWIKEAFGKKCGFIVICLNWIYNTIWYPTILALISGTVTYLFNPELAFNRLYMAVSVVLLFWICTWFNLYGMRISSLISTIGALIGTLFPMLFIVCLGIFWSLGNHPISPDFFKGGIFPSLKIENNLAFLTTVLFGLLGLEMSAAHALEMKNPVKDYPKAVISSAFLILVMIVLSSLSIAIVVSPNEINLATGVMQAFEIFLKAVHLNWLIPFVALCIILGGISSVGAWVIGPTKALRVALEDAKVFPLLTKKNKEGVPSRLLVIQAIFVSFLSLAFVVLPSVNASFWFLSVITAQLALVVYIFLFLAAIYLRHHKPEVKRSFKIPFGKIGIWTVSFLGLFSCVTVIGIGFIPPSQILIENVWLYETGLVLCLLGFGLAPLLFFRKKFYKN